MAVCACGGTMELSCGWCTKCWANWSTWFMRVGGVWLELGKGFQLTTRTCSCAPCVFTRSLVAAADLLEQRTIASL